MILPLPAACLQTSRAAAAAGDASGQLNSVCGFSKFTDYYYAILRNSCAVPGLASSKQSTPLYASLIWQHGQLVLALDAV